MLNNQPQPFTKQVRESVHALHKMASSLDTQLSALLVFFGENPDSPEAPKPEDFFGLILTFSTSLQVSLTLAPRISLTFVIQKAALEVHDAQPTQLHQLQPQTPTVEIELSPSTPTQESVRLRSAVIGLLTEPPPQTIRLGDGTVHSLLPPPSSQGRAAGLSLGRGDLDQAIRSMRDGRRRARPHRPVSKIFVDGARSSRIYD